jgi:phosphotransferase system enzyme I (PtsI)
VTQLRAFARAAALGPVKVMLPMVTVPAEVERARDLLATALRQLREADVACAAPELGMMVEVPAAALTLDLFAADFFSIGSNDLVAYLTACGRDADALAALADPLHDRHLRRCRRREVQL